MVTVTPSSVAGSLPLTMDLSQVSVTAARLLPLMVAQEFGTIPGRKLAPLTTPFVEMAGGDGGVDFKETATSECTLSSDTSKPEATKLNVQATPPLVLEKTPAPGPLPSWAYGDCPE